MTTDHNSHYLYDHHQQQQQQQREKEESSETHWCREIASKAAGKAKFLDASDQDTVSFRVQETAKIIMIIRCKCLAQVYLFIQSLTQKLQPLSGLSISLYIWNQKQWQISLLLRSVLNPFPLGAQVKGGWWEWWLTYSMCCFGLLLGMIISRPA